MMTGKGAIIANPVLFIDWRPSIVPQIKLFAPMMNSQNDPDTTFSNRNARKLN
jgi:hypothetical protein